MSAGTPFRLAILISGRGSNMIAIARACLAGSIPARVAVVISDRADAAGLAGAAALGIETATVLQLQGGGDSAFERSLAAALQKHQPDMIALAGFMRILGGGLTEELPKMVRQEVTSGIHAHATPEALRKLKIVTAKHKGHAVTIGAAKLALDSK